MGETIKNTVKNIPRRRWFVLIPVCFLVNFFCGLDRSIISVALTGGMQQDLALDATMSGMITGITAIGLMVLAVPAGQISQRGKLKKSSRHLHCWLEPLIYRNSFCTKRTRFASNSFLIGCLRRYCFTRFDNSSHILVPR